MVCARQVVRMLELVREDPVQPYSGSRSQFGEMVRRIRLTLAQVEAAATVPVRFEGLPCEYLQVEWGDYPGVSLQRCSSSVGSSSAMRRCAPGKRWSLRS